MWALGWCYRIIGCAPSPLSEKSGNTDQGDEQSDEQAKGSHDKKHRCDEDHENEPS